jgi:hypothetical protein
MNSHRTVTGTKENKKIFEEIVMKKIKTCEEYVLSELEEKREQLKRLKEACKSYVEVMDDVNTFQDIMEKHMIIIIVIHGR